MFKVKNYKLSLKIKKEKKKNQTLKISKLKNTLMCIVEEDS